jgi:acyl carrier protein
MTIFDDLKIIIADIVGEDFALEMDIRPDSSFARDLEMDSIEIVTLSEKIKDHFGKDIDFTGWLSGMDIDELIALKVKDVIEYISLCQS